MRKRVISHESPDSNAEGDGSDWSDLGRLCGAEITSEVEDYAIEIDGVTALELKIVPDIDGGEAIASLARLRLA